MPNHYASLAKTYPLYAEIQRRFEAGESIEQIAEALDDQPQFIRYRLQQMHLVERDPPPPGKWERWSVWDSLVPPKVARKQHNYEWRQACRRAYEAGMTIEEMSKWFGYDQTLLQELIAEALKDKKPPVTDWLRAHTLRQVIQRRIKA